MGIDPRFLSPAAQKQIAEKLLALEKQKAAAAEKTAQAAEQKKDKPNKYRAEKVFCDGMEFDSKKELTRWKELEWKQRAGQITDLRRQVRYELLPKQTRADGTTERAIFYVADFVYVENGQEIVEDVKGYRDPSSAAYAKFTIKRKMMLYFHGITVREV